MTTDWQHTDDEDGWAAAIRRRDKDVTPPPTGKGDAKRKAHHRRKARDRRKPAKPNGIHNRRIKGFGRPKPS